MSNNSNIKENSFDGAGAGYAGSSNVNPSLGTYSSPNVTQNPEHFANSSGNKYYNQDSEGQHDPALDNPSGSLNNDINQLFMAKETPTPDEVLAGLEFEMSNMVHKDKRAAKQVVITNLKKDPKFYSSLKMLNIDDKDMNINENVSETKKVLDKMIKDRKDQQPEPNQAILDILKEKRDKKLNRMDDLIKISIL